MRPFFGVNRGWDGEWGTRIYMLCFLSFPHILSLRILTWKQDLSIQWAHLLLVSHQTFQGLWHQRVLLGCHLKSRHLEMMKSWTTKSCFQEEAFVGEGRERKLPVCTYCVLSTLPVSWWWCSAKVDVTGADENPVSRNRSSFPPTSQVLLGCLL